MEKTDSMRYWRGLGVVVMAVPVLAIVVVVAVVIHTRSAKPQKALQTQASVTTKAPVRAQATVKPPATVRPPAMVTPQATPKPQGAAKPLTDAQRKVSEELWVEQKRLETDSARVSAATPDGRRRIVETIAKQFNVPEKLVNDLRGRKIAYGEITVALALSQQLIKREKVTQQQALDRVLGARKSGQGWGALARDLGLKLPDVVSDVKKADKQVAKLVTVKAAR